MDWITDRLPEPGMHILLWFADGCITHGPVGRDKTGTLVAFTPAGMQPLEPVTRFSIKPEYAWTELPFPEEFGRPWEGE